MKKVKLQELLDLLESQYGLVPAFYELDEDENVAILVIGQEQYVDEFADEFGMQELQDVSNKDNLH